MEVSELVQPGEAEIAGAREVRSSGRGSAVLRSLLREPLVHFLLLGSLLFLVYEWKGAAGPGSKRVLVTRAEMEHLAAGFETTWQREPNRAEMKSLVDEYVKDEIATREGISMGLDREDTIIRRRLRQKLEFIAEDTTALAPPSDAELQGWLSTHPQSYLSEPQLAFRQVYLDPQRRGAATRADAQRLLAHLQAARGAVSIDRMGDPSMLPPVEPLASLAETSRVFGADFAKRLMLVETGKWVGPIESSYGLHLVFVTQRIAAAPAQLEAVRSNVERDFLADRRKKQLQALYDHLLESYTVKFEEPVR